MTERRAARRYDLSLPVMIQVPVERQTAPRTGRTQDISPGGVFFFTDYDLSAGTELDLTMTLSAEITGGTEAFIRAIGKVIRAAKSSADRDPSTGVAATITRYAMVRNAAATLLPRRK